MRQLVQVLESQTCERLYERRVKVHLENGNTYIGRFKGRGAKCDDNAKLTFDDDRFTYEGGFLDDVRQGFGTISSVKGSIIEEISGNYLDYLFEGEF